MNMNQWALKWGVPHEALVELTQMNATEYAPNQIAEKGEARVQSLVRLEAARKGMYLWRNQNGAFKNDRGRWVRFGLGNDSKQANEICKSSDLIGIRKTLIQPHMVGWVIGQFVAREMKPEGWQFSGTEHEVAQRTFIDLVNANGGDAQFCNQVGTL